MIETPLLGPTPRSGSVDFVAGGDDVELYRQGGLRVWRTRDGYAIHSARAALARLDAAANVIDAVIASPDDARLYADLIGVLARALHGRLRGRFHIHAGLVVDAHGQGTLICGDGGAGKTTTTLALMQAGRALAGDDVGFLTLDDERVRVEALSRALHVGPATMAMFPQLLPHVRDAASMMAGKQIVDVAPAASTVGVAFPVGCLVFPCITPTPTAACRLPPQDVFPRLLVASAMAAWRSLPHAQEHLDVLGRLLRVPAFAIDIGPDARDQPVRIAAALTGVFDAAPGR